MSSINLHNDEIGIKVVYYGPGLGGKTSSIQHMHHVLKPDSRGQLISLATGIDRTLYFDFLPVKLPKIRGFSIRMSLYTVPGQVHYDATRKLVLQGADGVVFVADSQLARHDANNESMENLRVNLKTHGMNPNTVPLVIQYNKRDLPNVMPVDQMNTDLNPRGVPYFATCAVSGEGVFESLKSITKLVLADLKRKGIYQEKGTETASRKTEESKTPSWTPEIEKPRPKAPREQSAIVNAIEAHMETVSPSQIPPAPEEEISQPLGLSNLWKPGAGHEHIIALEQHIIEGDYLAAVNTAQDALRAHLDDVAGPGTTTAEALLALGVHGGHYVRFQGAVSRGDPTISDALFCLFFLTDVDLRMQAAGVQLLQ